MSSRSGQAARLLDHLPLTATSEYPWEPWRRDNCDLFEACCWKIPCGCRKLPNFLLAPLGCALRLAFRGTHRSPPLSTFAKTAGCQCQFFWYRPAYSGELVTDRVSNELGTAGVTAIPHPGIEFPNELFARWYRQQLLAWSSQCSHRSVTLTHRAKNSK